jgi:hypothetical protein
MPRTGLLLQQEGTASASKVNLANPGKFRLTLPAAQTPNLLYSRNSRKAVMSLRKLLENSVFEPEDIQLMVKVSMLFAPNSRYQIPTTATFTLAFSRLCGFASRQPAVLQMPQPATMQHSKKRKAPASIRSPPTTYTATSRTPGAT